MAFKKDEVERSLSTSKCTARIFKQVKIATHRLCVARPPFFTPNGPNTSTPVYWNGAPTSIRNARSGAIFLRHQRLECFLTSYTLPNRGFHRLPGLHDPKSPTKEIENVLHARVKFHSMNRPNQRANIFILFRQNSWVFRIVR